MLTDVSLFHYLWQAFISWKAINKNIKAIKAWKLFGDIPDKLSTPSTRLTSLLICEGIRRKAKAIEVTLRGVNTSASIKMLNNNYESSVMEEISDLEIIEEIARNILFLSGEIEPTLDEYDTGVMQRKFILKRCGPWKIEGVIEYRFLTINDLRKEDVPQSTVKLFLNLIENLNPNLANEPQ